MTSPRSLHQILGIKFYIPPVLLSLTPALSPKTQTLPSPKGPLRQHRRIRSHPPAESFRSLACDGWNSSTGVLLVSKRCYVQSKPTDVLRPPPPRYVAVSRATISFRPSVGPPIGTRLLLASLITVCHAFARFSVNYISFGKRCRRDAEAAPACCSCCNSTTQSTNLSTNARAVLCLL